MKTEVIVFIDSRCFVLELPAPISVPVLSIRNDYEILVATVFNGYNFARGTLQYGAIISTQRVPIEKLLAAGFKEEYEETQERRA